MSEEQKEVELKEIIETVEKFCLQKEDIFSKLFSTLSETEKLKVRAIIKEYRGEE